MCTVSDIDANRDRKLLIYMLDVCTLSKLNVYKIIDLSKVKAC